MAIRPLITLPSPILRKISKPVEAVGDDERQLMDDMLDTLHAANGIGLAAIQIGVDQRIIVIDLGREEEEEEKEKTRPFYFANPEIVWCSEEMAVYTEGCLSVPEFFDDVDRPARCRVRFLDYHGKQQEREFDGLLATCIQHEMDHLEGILFIDHLSRLKRDLILKKLKKAARRERLEQPQLEQPGLEQPHGVAL